MIYLLLYLCLIVISTSEAVAVQCSSENANNPLQSPFPDADKVLLGNNYKATIRYTNWLSGATAKFRETSINDTLCIKKTTRNSAYSLYAFSDRNVFYKSNLSNGFEVDQECHNVHKEAEETNLYDVSPYLLEFLNVKVIKFSNILEAVVKSQRYNSSSLDEAGTNITAGVETIGWLGCAFDAKNFTVQANVYYAGAFSKKPYSGAFNNPLVYSIHLQAYHVDNSTSVNMTDHISFDVVALDRIKGNSLISLPRGIYCENMTATDVPDGLPLNFNSQLQYYDSRDNLTSNIDLYFDSTELLYSFGLNFKTNRDFPFVGTSKFDANARIVHDFQYGLQYVISRNGTYCYGVEPIDPNMGDVWTNKSDTLFMRTLSDVLVNLTNEEFYYSGKVIDNTGFLLDSYVSKKFDDPKSNIFTVVELLYLEKMNSKGNKTSILYSIIQYHTDKSHMIIGKTTITISPPHLRDFEHMDLIDPCQKNMADEMLFITLGNVTMSDIQRAGYSNVKRVLTKELANVGEVSHLRITNFMFTTMGDALTACFTISEKWDSAQAKTAYLLPYLTADSVRDNLNASINGTNTFSVSIPFGKEKLVITSNEFGSFPIRRFPPPSPPPIMGYSASSMFVLGLFMFIFGQLTIVGGRIFYVKRNEIRGIAYQVFE